MASRSAQSKDTLNLNVKIGTAHQCFEDFTLMYSNPTMVVMLRTDDMEAKAMVNIAYKHDARYICGSAVTVRQLSTKQTTSVLRLTNTLSDTDPNIAQ